MLLRASLSDADVYVSVCTHMSVNKEALKSDGGEICYLYPELTGSGSPGYLPSGGRDGLPV